MIKEIGMWLHNVFQMFIFMVLCYFIGWGLGFLLAFTPFSEFINSGLNLIFDTERFTRDNFPVLLGTTLFFFSIFCRDKQFKTSLK